MASGTYTHMRTRTHESDFKKLGVHWFKNDDSMVIMKNISALLNIVS